jgi:hypothetical protein
MKQIAVLLMLVGSLLMSACSNESALPVATGKASITGINAIYGSPTLNFQIEERSLGTVAYKSTTTSANYDDLEYTFNFDVFLAGENAVRRIASQSIDLVADQQYTLLASGTLESTVLTLWETSERDFADTDTVFQARFAHTSDTLQTIDVYFALDGVAPAAGEAVATLSFGEISAPIDFETGDYVVTLTTSGDPADILFQSKPNTVLQRSNLIITPFDGDANDTSPIVVRALSPLGRAFTFHDPLYPSTLQFLHASQDLGSSDVYDDEALTSQVLTDHSFKQLTADAPIDAGEYQFFYTPAGDTSAVTVETTAGLLDGAHFRIIATGTGGVYSTTNIALDRRSINTAGKLNLYSSSSNFNFIDLYLVNAGETIEGIAPFRSGVISRVSSPSNAVNPGSYDVYVTSFAETETIAGPFSLDVAIGDVIDMVIFDTVDTAQLEIVVYPAAP